MSRKFRQIGQKTSGLRYRILGARLRPFSDLYHHLMRGSWVNLILLSFVLYLVVIALFALLFWMGGDCITNAEPGSLPDAFWFSVQTFSTIGYGSMSPKTMWAHVLVTIESFVGLTGVAMGTALMFAKFSRPNARVVFSNRAVVHERNGVPTLIVRLANERTNYILNAKLMLSVLIEETTSEGHYFRKVVDLELVRSQLPIFVMSWTAMHELNESSPLHGLSEENIKDRVIIMIATFEGMDDTYMQTVSINHVFSPEHVIFDAEFEDIMILSEEGATMDHVNLHKIKQRS